VHVLLATDGSEPSIFAARHAFRLLTNADRVTLLSVVEDGEPGEDAGGIEGPVLTPEEEAALWQQELSEAHAELAATSGAMPDIPVDKIVEVGDAASGICQVAERLGVDVVVVGSHGRSGLARVFLGSVSEHVVRRAPCSVLVVRGSAK